jgi:para-nitrobenzyl esterase
LSGQGSPGFGGLTYSGEKFVPQGVVFVSYNLRLGVLGFPAHPALDAERVEKISGNYGSLDQIAMLRWLKANIAAFGGAPNKIFLFGTSAGGGNICALMTSPLTRGLIHGVAMQSSVPSGCEIQTLDNASNGLRKAAATRLADRGATTTQLMAWFGWKTSSEAERYTRTADRKRAAASAGKLITGTEIGKSENQFAKNEAKQLKS